MDVNEPETKLSDLMGLNPIISERYAGPNR